MSKRTVTPDPKPEKRKRASQDDWTLLRERLHRVRYHCQVRGCEREGAEAHHLIPRGQGGSDEWPNLSWLCRTCHRDVTEWKGSTRARLGAGLDRIQLGYILQKKGEAWSEVQYGMLGKGDGLLPAAPVPLSERAVAPDADGPPSLSPGVSVPARSPFIAVPKSATEEERVQADQLWADCMLILERMGAPLHPTKRGVRFRGWMLILEDFRDRWQEHLRGAV